MIPAEARGSWQEIEARLRLYVARRVPSAADASDVLQDICLKVHGGLGSLQTDERFGAWIYRIAERAVADHHRALARRAMVRSELISETAATPLAGEDLQGELARCVTLFVARLPSPYREAITLTELHGLTQRNAAAILAVPLSTLKSRVARGREKIRDMFEQCCELSLDVRGRVVQCEPRPLDEIPKDCRRAAVAWSARRRASID